MLFAFRSRQGNKNKYIIDYPASLKEKIAQEIVWAGISSPRLDKKSTNAIFNSKEEYSNLSFNAFAA